MPHGEFSAIISDATCRAPLANQPVVVIELTTAIECSSPPGHLVLVEAIARTVAPNEIVAPIPPSSASVPATVSGVMTIHKLSTLPIASGPIPIIAITSPTSSIVASILTQGHYRNAERQQ